MVTLAAVTAAELEQLAVLYEELIGQPTNRAKLAACFARVNENPDYYLAGAKLPELGLVASMQGIVCVDLVGECQPFMVLENVIVSTLCRGQGVGRQLLAHMEEFARQRGCAFIMLLSSAYRQEAHAFYRQNGYDGNAAQGFKKFL